MEMMGRVANPVQNYYHIGITAEDLSCEIPERSFKILNYLLM